MIAILTQLSLHLAVPRGLVAVGPGPNYTIPIILGIAVIAVAALAATMTLKKGEKK
jgi:hypothetical protein